MSGIAYAAELMGYGTLCKAACKAPLLLPPSPFPGISFFACPGELTALMGGSGAQGPGLGQLFC